MSEELEQLKDQLVYDNLLMQIVYAYLKDGGSIELPVERINLLKTTRFMIHILLSEDQKDVRLAYQEVSDDDVSGVSE